ncbi:HtaA domain-containing protein [Nocardioides zeae]|uniref:Htaa domain-containing protein n=1 Tax=Nocardioides zeae TaxID=1457234 RepID=A0A6P0HKH9_9ACTN|nr:HtaA domain-containing protein [Nocardioides zeae]NEN79111.1 hypothetical protein [Nocardioides zeae]
MTSTTETDRAGAPAHGLRWGIKASFIDYVRRMPGGQGTIADGAVPVGTAEVLFTLDPTPPVGTSPGTTRAWAFAGDVRFAGHGGMMFVRLALPRLEVAPGGSARLTIEDPHQRPDAPRIPLVDLTLVQHPSPEAAADGVELWASDDVRLTAEGVALFNDVYAAGEPFEPLTVVVPIGSGTV